jgi:hypothetical protein
MIFAERSRPTGRLAQQRSWKRFAASDRRWRGEAGEAQRSSRAAAAERHAFAWT